MSNLKALFAKFETIVPVAKAPESDAVKVLNDVYERIGAMLTKVQESNGAMPAGLAAEITTAAGMLLQLAPPGAAPAAGATTPAGVPAAAPGTVHVAQPGTVPVVLSSTTKRALAARLTKAELDEYTARITTINAANERWWKMRSFFEQGKDTEGNAELKGIADMINNVVNATGAAAAAPSTVTGAEKREVTFTQEQYAAYAVGQVQKAAKETRDEAVKRLTHLRELNLIAKAWFFEGTNAGLPWKVEIATAYAPEGDGKALDLTSSKDQQQTTGNLLGGNPGTQTPSIFKADALAKMEDALKELLGGLAEAPAGDGTTTADGSPAGEPAGEGDLTDLSKAAPGDFVWPNDLAAQIKADEEAAAAKKRGLAKNDSSGPLFGFDPWHSSRRGGAAR